MTTCLVSGCAPSRRGSLGYCSKHYARLKKWGDPLYDSRDPELRFWAKVEKTAGCWYWRGALADTGYGVFNVGEYRYEHAHRFSYKLVMPIPEGAQLDHLCRIRRCVRPSHLEPVTATENIRRAVRIGHDHPNAPRTCKRGHDWTANPPYLAHRADGAVTRRCRVCAAMREKARRRAA